MTAAIGQFRSDAATPRLAAAAAAGTAGRRATWDADALRAVSGNIDALMHARIHRIDESSGSGWQNVEGTEVLPVASASWVDAENRFVWDR